MMPVSTRGSRVLDDFGDLSQAIDLSEDSKYIIAFIERKFATMDEKFSDIIKSKNEEIDGLHGEIKGMKEDISKLKDLIDQGDAYERRDVLIFSGTKLPEVSAGENCKQILHNIVKENLRIEISHCDISTAHRLGTKPQNQSADKRPIIAKFCRRDTKRELLYNGRKARVLNLFVNESLTPTRKTIFTALRRMKKIHPNLVKGVTTYDGSVFAFTKPLATATRDRRHHIQNHESLVEFCREYVKLPLETFLENFRN